MKRLKSVPLAIGALTLAAGTVAAFSTMPDASGPGLQKASDASGKTVPVARGARRCPAGCARRPSRSRPRRSTCPMRHHMERQSPRRPMAEDIDPGHEPWRGRVDRGPRTIARSGLPLRRTSPRPPASPADARQARGSRQAGEPRPPVTNPTRSRPPASRPHLRPRSRRLEPADRGRTMSRRESPAIARHRVARRRPGGRPRGEARAGPTK